MAWIAETGHIVYPFERAIIRAMDVAYCAAVNRELSEYRERESEAMKSEKARK